MQACGIWRPGKDGIIPVARPLKIRWEPKPKTLNPKPYIARKKEGMPKPMFPAGGVRVEVAMICWLGGLNEPCPWDYTHPKP